MTHRDPDNAGGNPEGNTARKGRGLGVTDLQTLFEQGPDAIIIVGAENRIEAVNPAACAMLGYAAEELVGEDGARLIHPDSLAAQPLQIRDVLAGAVVAIERELVGRDGRIIPVEIRAARLRGGRIMIVARDISERRAAEATRRALADSLRTITANAPIILFALDADGTFTLSEGKGLAPLGLKPGEVVGRSAFDIYGNYPEIVDQIRRALAGERRFLQVEVAGIVFETAYEPVVDAGGRVTGVIGVALDVTSRVRAEQELRHSERRYRALAEDSSDVIITYRVEEGPHGPERRKEWVSDSIRRIMGYEPEEFLAAPLASTVVPGDRASLEDAFQRAIASAGEPVTAECRVMRKDGTVLSAEVVIVNRLADPEIQAIVATFRDMTARKRAEERLQQVERMEAIGRLAGGVAHDFNNILTVILGYSAQALGTVPPGSEQHEAFREIHAAAERGAALTRQLLAFGRRQPMRRTVMDLNEAVHGLQELLQPVMRQGIALELRLEPGLWPIEADRTQIDQVIMNLVLNARDAMPGGGTITVSTQNQRDGDSRSVVLTVEDTGGGISEDILPFIFEPFFTTKGVGRGTGMGLAIVHGIVAQTGGEVSVASAPGDGARFTVRFPAA
ncbi:MAG: hypothetical protein Kow0010_05140 [Dehalococcoidia bacterium]